MPARAQAMRIAVVVHETRSIASPLRTLEDWAAEHSTEIVQIRPAGDGDRTVAPPGEVEDGDLVVSLGGDGTVLAALRASAQRDAPVLGVACGSLGALTAVPAEGLRDALDRVRAGDWTAHRLPALVIRPGDGPEEWAVNDFVVVRGGSGQVVVGVSVDDELYARLAGDGLVVASALGSTAYTMAANGPVLVPGTPAVVCTPLAMHGGSAPPLVVPATSTVGVRVDPGFEGFRIEIDGRRRPLEALDYRIALHEGKVTLVSFGRLGIGLTELRSRGLVADSPRVLARDRRASEQAEDR